MSATHRSSPTRAAKPRAAKRRMQRPPPGRVHPVIIFPFRPYDESGVRQLYELVARLDAQHGRYARPITVMDRKTAAARAGDRGFATFFDRVVARHSDVLQCWCVDTCQMWYSGLGTAYDRGGLGDVYWLIPGDFNYGSTVGREVLGRLHDLPEICCELKQDLCIGEIATDHNDARQLIDTYGTFALLYNWFPHEAAEIRQYTERPRSEFFALCHPFLGELLHRRWFAYEQTVVMLLRAVATGRGICRFFVGNITDMPEEGISLAAALQQVERTERVLKTVWRELHETQVDWPERYRQLEAQSESIRRTARIILENLLP